jgi:hypothetical protein
VCTDLQTVRQAGDLRRRNATRFQRLGPNAVAAPSAVRVAAGGVTNDFTTILSMNRDARAQTIAAFREIADGWWGAIRRD